MAVLSGRPTGRSVGVRARTLLDGVTDALATGELKRRIVAFHRWVGLTRSGYIAIVGAVILWLMAFVVAGTAMYIAAYGAVAFVVIALVIAPRRLGLVGE